MEIIKQLKKIDVIEIMKKTGAILEGHFKLTSGFHSRHYLQCAKLLQYPDITSTLVDSAVEEYSNDLDFNDIDAIVSPAVGAIIFGYMLAYKLGKKMLFTERSEGKMQLRRGLLLKPGEKVLIAEDVITTGGSVLEVIDVCNDFKAEAKGIISIVDRSEEIQFGYPFFSFIKINVEKYSPGDCPLCRSGVEFHYLGSRKQ